VATTKIQGQTISDFMFDTYLIKEGMSQSSVMSIYQDKVGYIWVGTQSGVDRFDGYNFKQYAHDLKNDKTRSIGWVLDITEDKEGNIWTVDNQGHFSKLDRATDQWSNYTLPFRDSLFKKNGSLRYNFGTPRNIYIDTLTTIEFDIEAEHNNIRRQINEIRKTMGIKIFNKVEITFEKNDYWNEFLSYPTGKYNESLSLLSNRLNATIKFQDKLKDYNIIKTFNNKILYVSIKIIINLI
jgi:hypothetical protein